MSCKFYDFRQGDYYCCKSQSYVSEDMYYKYCRNYDYDDCPVYRDEGSGGCFITTACVYSLNCSDDSDILNCLRSFRDNYLAKSEEGKKSIKEYYQNAPKIVNEINKKENRVEIYQTIFSYYIKPCLKLIRNRELCKAYNLYKKMYYELARKYLQRRGN